jgi:hypothetical protein
MRRVRHQFLWLTGVTLCLTVVHGCGSSDTTQTIEEDGSTALDGAAGSAGQGGSVGAIKDGATDAPKDGTAGSAASGGAAGTKQDGGAGQGGASGGLPDGAAGAQPDSSAGGAAGNLPDGAAGDVSQTTDGPEDSTAPDVSDVMIEPKAGCGLVGEVCLIHSDCCTANCDPQTNICANAIGTCKPAGAGCLSPAECCTTVCSAGVCGATVCTSDNQSCLLPEQCCSGRCEGATESGLICQPLNPNCFTVGNVCNAHADCCSKFCNNGRCSAQPSFCIQTGDACTDDFECCGGLCTKGDGSVMGLCALPAASGAGNCRIAGEVCGAGAVDGGVSYSDAGIPACGGDCCSRACAPYGPTGVMICQPASGCRPVGEICRDDSDCCGSPGLPGGNGTIHCSKEEGSPVGRCDNGNACNPAGAICKLEGTSCNAANNCCAGNVNQNPYVCLQDLLGIPRCRTTTEACDEAGSYQGKACASSADCCGMACVPNPEATDAGDAGPPRLICGDTCVQQGGVCTSDVDCCPGLPCVALPGSSLGICGYVPPPDAGMPDGNVADAVVPSDGTVPDSTIPPDGTVPDASVAPDGTVPDASVPDVAADVPRVCSLYGQSCQQTSDCCNAVPCTNGRCVFPPS